MFFAVNYGSNKNIPQILCACATFDDVIQMIKNKTETEMSQEFEEYDESGSKNQQDDDLNGQPYEIHDVEHTHIVSYILSHEQASKLRDCDSMYYGCMISIFESIDQNVDFAKVIDSLDIL